MTHQKRTYGLQAPALFKMRRRIRLSSSTSAPITMPQAQTHSPHRKACKECRRLRLGCDREVPCYNCKRRGCSAICPDGTLEKGARSRSTIIVELQETIAELRARNYQLEDALRNLQALVSRDTHPLLREKKCSKALPPLPTPVLHEEILDALGTFSIVGDDGEFSVYGPTAASEYLVREDPRLLPNLMMPESEQPMSLPADIVLLSALFPFPPGPLPIQKMDDFVPHLPPFEIATHLADHYFTHFAWCTDPIPRPSFTACVLAECYPGDKPVKSLQHIQPHLVSLLFMVFGLGSLANMEDPQQFVTAEEYHTLARACLCVQPAYENPTVWAVQSMTIMMFYHMCTEKRSAGYSLALWSVLARLCETLGLNHDQRKLKKGCAELREKVFWEAMNLDSWQAFSSGRAKSLSFKVISCKRPVDYEQTPGGGWTTWKHNFTTALDSVVERAFREKGATYSQIQALESELRDQPAPPAISWPDAHDEAAVLSAPGESSRAAQRYLAYSSTESALLHLHRWFFLQAIREMPENPFEHPFAQSVRTVIRSSYALIEGLGTIYTYQPAMTASFRPFWTHVYSGAMVLASLVVTCPQVAEAFPALSSLDRACELFQATAPNRVQTRQSLQILLNLREEAHRAWSERRGSAAQVESLGFWTSVPSPWPPASTPPTQLSPSSWDGSV